MYQTDSVSIVIAVASPVSLILLWGVGARSGVALGFAVLTMSSLTVAVRLIEWVTP